MMSVDDITGKAERYIGSPQAAFAPILEKGKIGNLKHKASEKPGKCFCPLQQLHQDAREYPITESAENTDSASSAAFFRLLKSRELAEPFVAGNEGETVMMLRDDWRARVINFAMSAEGESAVTL
jgi:hypothetical protein